MQPIRQSKLVWLILPTNATAGAEIRFPDVPELRGKVIDGIEAYNEDLLAATPDLQPVIAAVDGSTITLVLKDASTERIQDMPFTALIPTNVSGIWKQVVPFEVNWQSSFVRLVATPGTLNVSVPFNVFYHDPQGR